MNIMLNALIDPFLLVCTVRIGFFTRGDTRLKWSAGFLVVYGICLACLTSYHPGVSDLAFAKFIDAGVILGLGMLLVRERVNSGLDKGQGTTR